MPPPPYVLPFDEDLGDVVRRERRGVAKRAVVGREDVALGSERVVAGADGRPPVDARRGPRDPGLGRGRTNAPHVEVRLAALEWLGRKQRLDEALGVLLELRLLGGGVAVAENQQVDLGGRIAVLQQLDHRPRRRRRGGIDELIRRIDLRRPDLAKQVRRVSLLHHDLDGVLGLRESQRLLERPRGGARLVGRLPLAEDRREPARIDDAIGRACR